MVSVSNPTRAPSSQERSHVRLPWKVLPQNKVYNPRRRYIASRNASRTCCGPGAGPARISSASRNEPSPENWLMPAAAAVSVASAPLRPSPSRRPLRSSPRSPGLRQLHGGRTNQTQEAWVSSNDGPIRDRREARARAHLPPLLRPPARQWEGPESAGIGGQWEPRIAPEGASGIRRTHLRLPLRPHVRQVPSLPPVSVPLPSVVPLVTASTVPLPTVTLPTVTLPTVTLPT
eukprot:7795134-Pyramimonas_sp.AAC.1